MIKVICRRSSSCLATVSMLSSFNPEFYLPHKGPRQDWQIKRRETRASARWGLKNFPSPLRRRQERKQFRGKWYFEIIRRRSNWRIFYLGGALIGLQRDVLFDFFRLSQPASQSKNQCDLFVVWGTFRVHQAAVVGRKWSEMIRETPPSTSPKTGSPDFVLCCVLWSRSAATPTYIMFCCLSLSLSLSFSLDMQFI